MFKRKQIDFEIAASPEASKRAVRQRARESYMSRALFTLAGVTVAGIAMLSLSDDVGNRTIEPIGGLDPKGVLVFAGLSEAALATGAVVEKRRAINRINDIASSHTTARYLISENANMNTARQQYEHSSHGHKNDRSLLAQAKDVAGQAISTSVEIITGTVAAVIMTSEAHVTPQDEVAANLFLAGYVMTTAVTAAANTGAVGEASREANHTINLAITSDPIAS